MILWSVKATESVYFIYIVKYYLKLSAELLQTLVGEVGCSGPDSSRQIAYE